ncbi:Lnb N-terminal periplasmic domain-containing protein [Hyphococcus sp.]|uniref:Lnb N-terminal periplasmic domain-containing protein n=1 Tax=Hyphococcus sp. TaxID=2038636 RepID=UPI0035C706B0
MTKIAIALAVALALGFILSVVLKTPRHDRDWVVGLSRMPVFEPMADGHWRLQNLRAFEFSQHHAAKDWRDTKLNPADLEEIWFFVEPFPAFKGAAHTFISFVFGGDTDQTIAISVEARKERGEVYSGFNGLFNKFELIYLWSTEKDVLTRIAVGLGHDLYAYKLDVTTEQGREILMHFIERTNELEDHPRFYNTFTSNCTNELVKSINGAFPGALPWHYSHVLTGYSARRLHHLGFLEHKAAPFESLRSHALASEPIRAAAEESNADFPDGWRKLKASEKD